MKAIFPLTLLLFFVSVIPKAQNNSYEPQILILAPSNAVYPKKFEKDILSATRQIKEDLNKKQKGPAPENNTPPNLVTMLDAEKLFEKNITFFKMASLISEEYFSYRFFEKFTNLLIMLKDTLIMLKDTTVNGSNEELLALADKEQFQYILNFPRIELYTRDGTDHAKVAVQLYDRNTNTLLLNQTYDGDNRSPGFEFACRDGSINCTLNNALSLALDDVIKIIATESPTLKAERELALKRYNLLISQFFSAPFDSLLVKNVIPPSDSTINFGDIYQCIYNSDKTKFVAFFITVQAKQSLKSLSENKADKNVTILSGKDIRDSDYLTDIPQKYAYIVKGVKQNNKWYYKKDKITYFEAGDLADGRKQYFSNLAEWSFFAENSTVHNPDFWETVLFEKIKDLRKDPEWDKYGKSIWKSEEKENRDYIGEYEMVAEQLKTEKEEENNNFQKMFTRNNILPFYKAEEKMDKKNFFRYYLDDSEKAIMIYPHEKSVILNPVITYNESLEKYLRYFVFFTDSAAVYEWTYLPPKPIDNKQFFYSQILIAQLGKLTEWDFSYTTLDDARFWQTYVLAREGGHFKYLKKIR